MELAPYFNMAQQIDTMTPPPPPAPVIIQHPAYLYRDLIRAHSIFCVYLFVYKYISLSRLQHIQTKDSCLISTTPE